MVWCGVSNQGVTPLHFCEKGVKTGARVYQEDVLQGVVKPLTHLSSMVRNGSSSRTYLLPKSQEDSGVAAEARVAIYQRRGLVLGEPRPQTPVLLTLDCFGVHGLPKASQQPGQSEEISRQSSGRDPPGEVACRDSRVAGASQGLRRVRRRPF